MSLRNVIIALSAALLFAGTGVALAQKTPNQDYGQYRSGQYPPPQSQYPVYGQPPYAANQAYQNGFQDGVNDGAHDRQTNHGFRAAKTEKYEDADSGYNSSFGSKDQYKQIYRQGYVAGYEQGFNGQAVLPSQGPYPVYGPQGPVYGQQPPYAGNPAYQNGFQDGLQDGQQDRQSNQAFRATNTKNYDHADNGYNSSLGDKQQYRGIYREGYVAGYQQGYGGQGPVATQPYPVYGQPPYPVYGQPYPAYPPQYPVAGQPGQAYQIGFQDGMNDGVQDRQSGHSFRPTKTEKYEDAPGYNKSFGDKNEYKSAYRQGYVAGYERAYGRH